ncbi:MAG: hypothetical protein IKB01_09270 [Lachnospiraceae bacterium]|nr:hypothetical protein [Lachnospiraceae bacterium]
MNYKDFLELLKTALEKEIRKRAWALEVALHQEMMDGRMKDGISIVSKEYHFNIFWRMDEDSINQAPGMFIHLNMQMDELVEDILGIYTEGLRQVEEIDKLLRDFELVKDAVLPTLYPKETFEHTEEARPHRKFLDLEVGYCIPGEKLGIPMGNILITDAMVKAWGITEETLERKAMDNMKRYSVLSDLAEMLQIAGEELKLLRNEQKSALYVVKYDTVFWGASAVMDSDKLNELANQIGAKRLLIIPSSKHECIVCNENDVDLEYVRMLIAETNTIKVRVEDVLSYCPYYYDVEDGYGMYD